MNHFIQYLITQLFILKIYTKIDKKKDVGSLDGQIAMTKQYE